ncbi:hypothetical protein GG681_10950 [Epibacterium sp. SM1969]|uniref:Uncharacterized protein n=1 Tax=Tritonibacter aquimaris TaxID=2663379 RepID=A0A844AUP2_9RHOB|nr:hypothetical protein [Tritonibacter aquimaris]MQY43158.1 hypothetical protein [Tritonibacter aquimaris]
MSDDTAKPDELWQEMAIAISSAYSISPIRIVPISSSEVHKIASVKRVDTEYMVRLSVTLDREITAVMDGIFRDPLLVDWLGIGSIQRVALSKLLSKVCLDFAFYHEIGHILAGHADKLKSSNLALHELELIKRKTKPSISRKTRQIWEYEADLIAAGYIAKDAARLIEDLQANDVAPDLRLIFGPHQIAVEQVSALMIVACYTLFCHLRDTAMELDLESYHPDPLVRAFVVRDALYSALSAEFPINNELFEILLGARFEEFDTALEEGGVRAGFPLNDAGIERVNSEMSHLANLARAYRATATDMGYVSWSEPTKIRTA